MLDSCSYLKMVRRFEFQEIENDIYKPCIVELKVISILEHQAVKRGKFNISMDNVTKPALP